MKPFMRIMMKRLKISTLSKYDISLDEGGYLTGVLEVVQETARKFTISDNQRELDLSKITQKPLSNKNSVVDSLIKPQNSSQPVPQPPLQEDASMVAEGFDTPDNSQNPAESSGSDVKTPIAEDSDFEPSEKSSEADLDEFE